MCASERSCFWPAARPCPEHGAEDEQAEQNGRIWARLTERIAADIASLRVAVPVRAVKQWRGGSHPPGVHLATVRPVRVPRRARVPGREFTRQAGEWLCDRNRAYKRITVPAPGSAVTCARCAEAARLFAFKIYDPTEGDARRLAACEAERARSRARRAAARATASGSASATAEAL